MGLDTTHGCWHGPYSYFNEWRAAVAEAAGIEDLHGYWELRPPENIEQLHGMWFHMPEGGPLAILFNHSDCEGYILSHHCKDLAEAMLEILPKVSVEWRNETERFIAGLLVAAEMQQNVEFR